MKTLTTFLVLIASANVYAQTNYEQGFLTALHPALISMVFYGYEAGSESIQEKTFRLRGRWAQTVANGIEKETRRRESLTNPSIRNTSIKELFVQVSEDIDKSLSLPSESQGRSAADWARYLEMQNKTFLDAKQKIEQLNTDLNRKKSLGTEFELGFLRGIEVGFFAISDGINWNTTDSTDVIKRTISLRRDAANIFAASLESQLSLVETPWTRSMLESLIYDIRHAPQGGEGDRKVQIEFLQRQASDFGRLAARYERLLSDIERELCRPHW